MRSRPGIRVTGGFAGTDGALRDLVLALVLAVVAGVYLVQALALPSTSPNQADIGPRAYPLLVVGLLGILTAVLAVQAVVQLTRRSGPPAADPAVPGGDDARRERRTALVRLALVVVATLVYLQLVILVGFLVASAVFLAAQAVLIGGVHRYRGRRAIVPIVFGVAGSASIYLLFDKVLGVVLPGGMLGL